VGYYAQALCGSVGGYALHADYGDGARLGKYAHFIAFAAFHNAFYRRARFIRTQQLVAFPEQGTFIIRSTYQDTLISLKTRDPSTMTEVNMFNYTLHNISTLTVPHSYCKIIRTCCQFIIIDDHLIDRIYVRDHSKTLFLRIYIKKILTAIQDKNYYSHDLCK